VTQSADSEQLLATQSDSGLTQSDCQSLLTQTV